MDSPRAAIYARISRDRTGEAAGVTRQEDDCRALIDREDWTLAREPYVDNDFSAYSGKQRPAYEQLLSDLKAGELDAVVAWHPDRLYRDMRDLEEFIDVVERHGVAVRTVTAGEVDLSTASGRMTARVGAAVARHESEQKAERVRRKHEELARDGKVANGGWRPFGYKSDRVTVEPAEADAIRDAARRLLAGASVQSILRDWRARGITAVAGRPWHTTAFTRMITSPRIAGLREHRGEITGQAVWPAIINTATHQELRATMLNGRRRQTARSYLLSGLVHCGLCGTVLLSKRSARRGRQHWCHSSPEHGGCGRIAIMADPLEAEIRDQVLAALAGPGLAKALRAAAGHDEEQRRLTDRLAEDERALEELTHDHYVDRIIGRKEFLAARDELEARRRDTRGRLRSRPDVTTLAALPADPDRLRPAWDNGDLEWRRSMLFAMVDRMVVHPAARNGGRFDPDRVEVVWRA